jgi:cruciform cutting endonuclease 1
MNLIGGLKAKALQHIAFLTGVPSTGTKSHILEQLNGSLHHARMPQGKTRILSVDMGIRNLAYCVIDVPADHQATNGKLQVQSWRRLDLLEKMRPEAAMPSSTPLPEQVADKPDVVAQAILKNSFTPSVMSKVALQVTQDFLAHKPDIILIERQRFRSGGGSAIQEWTVRVNTLESMLWACFETMKAMQARSEHGTFPAVHEVAPKRVASFWTSPPDAHRPPASLFAPDFSPPELKVIKSTTKAANAGKKEKIAVLRSWLDGSGGVALDFSPETQSIAAAFATGFSRRKSKGDGASSAGPAIERETKLDDLADCVLQGAAWVRWEENRREIAEISDGTRQRIDDEAARKVWRARLAEEVKRQRAEGMMSM